MGDETTGTLDAGRSDSLADLIVRSATDFAIITSDADGVITSWSPGAEKTMGWPAEDAVGKRVDMFFTPEDVAAGIPQAEMDGARRDGATSDERWHMKADGSRFWANGEMQPLRANARDGAGEIVGYVKILRDRTERHDMEQRLRSAQAQAEKLAIEQAAILGQLAEGVIATDAEGRIKFVNAAAERLHGVARLDVEPDAYSDTYQLLTEDGLPYPSAELPLARAVLRGETVTDARWRIRRPDGTEVLAIGNAQPVIADGRQVGAVLTVRDDTARRDAESALAASEARTRNVLEGMDEGFIAVDGDMRLLQINAEGLRIDGRPREEIVGRTLLDVWPESAHLPNLALFEEVLRTGKPGTIEYRHRSDVHDVWLEARAYPINGGLAIFYRDVTDRRSATEAVQASEARLKAITDSIDQMIWSTRPDGFHDYFNRRWFEYTGVPEGSTDGEEWLGLFHPDDQARTEAVWAQCLRTGELYDIEYRLRHCSGEYRWVAGRAQAIRDEDGAITRWYGTCTDIHDAKVADAALRDREAQFRELADNIPTLCWTAHANGNIFWYNKRWYDYSGTTPETQLGWGWEAIHDPAFLPEVTRQWSHSIATGTPFSMTFPLKGADGKFRRFLTRTVPIIDEQGQVVRWFGTNIDVEEQTAAEERMLASEKQYRTLFEAIDVGFCILELKFDEAGRAVDYRMVEVNPAFARQTGLVDPAGKWISEVAPAIEQHWKDAYGKVARTRQSARFENESPALGRWFDVYAFAVDEPEAQRVAVLFTDVSDRKRAALELNELNRTLESRVAETIAERDMIWRTSQDLFAVTGLSDRKYRSVNPAWTTTLGWAPEEVLTFGPIDLVHPDDVLDGQTWLEKLLKGEVLAGVDLRMRHKDGRYLWFSWTCVPHGDVFYASGRDVTARKELEEQLRQSQKMEAVGQLTGGIAHDFNNLLTIVSGNIDMARRSLGVDGDARALRSLGNAAKGADRAAALTQRLLAFSRRQPLQPRATDVNKLITGMTELLDRALGETVDLQVVAGAGLWRVEVDPNQLENAIVNLAVNARDAMAGDTKPGGGKLTVETTNAHIDEAYAAAQREVAPGQYVLISVTDTGEGMPPDIVAKAFDPFFSTKEVGRGTGLGLSQVYGYVKQSGGHVKIYSEAGEGTTVKLYLPRLIADMNAAEEEDIVPEEPTQGRESILVVEDDDDVRIYTVDSLRELGYRVLEAHDGASALRLLERQDEPPRLLLTDVVMPGMSGRGLADQARVLYPDMRVLYTTGYARNAIVHGGRLDPGVELLPKPFTFEALAAKIREVIEKVSVERALVIDPFDDSRDTQVALLSELGFAAEQAGTVREALGKLRAASGGFDVVILSQAVPVGNLDAVLSELRAVRSDLPVLIVGRGAAISSADPCIGFLGGAPSASTLRSALEILRVRCNRS